MPIDIILESNNSRERVRELGELAEANGVGAVWVSNMNDARDSFINFVPLAMNTIYAALMPRTLKAPTIVFALVALGTLSGTPARADLVTYRFTGSIQEAPVELTDLAYGSGPNPLVFTLVVNTGIPADVISDNPPISSSATYSSAIVSATLELGGQVVATSTAGSAGRYRQFPGLVSAQDVFTYTIPTPGGFSSGPFRGLTPTSLNLDIRSLSNSAFASLALPNPFPALGFPFQEQSLLLTFASPATQPLRSFLTNVTTTTVIPLPAAAWLFASGAGLLAFLRRRL